MQQRLNIAIDGPAGAGKSTVAKAVAQRLGIRYLDTGAMYRAMALLAIRAGISVKDETAVAKLLPEADISVRYTENGQRILLAGEDVTDLLRTNELGMGASDVSKHPCVRIKLTELQRAVAKEYDVIMDGRDIGTNVLKDSPHKFYLIADARERARRRLGELQQKGLPCGSIEEIEREIVARDHNDSTRAFMPLRQAEDAMCIDTTGMTVDAVVQTIVSAVKGERV